MKRTYLTAVFVAVLVACGGTVTSIENGNDTGGDNDTGKGGDSGSGSCTKTDVAGDRACVPGFAKANSALTIDLDQTEGCLGCFTTLLPCNVSVSGNEISVGMEASVCERAGDQVCPAICGLAKVSCTIPPLAAGTYTVKVSGEPAASSGSRQLVVGDEPSAETSCSLGSPGVEPEPIDVSALPRACSNDNECVAVATAPCQTCGCYNAVISTSAKAEFDALKRGRSSQCKPPSGPVACPPCVAVLPHCKIEGNALTGTCEFGP